MNARKRALLKYGAYGAGALVCALLAALGSFKVFPLVTGSGRPLFLAGVALVMILHGAAHLRTKRQDCFIVRREELMGGSFILFVGAVLFLVLMLAGCSPATAKVRRAQAINFYGGESTEAWTVFGADGPFFIAAQEPPERTQKSNQTACRRMRSCRLAALGSQSLRCSSRASACAPGGTNRCPEQATPNDRI
jgi:hypothetical protein